MSQYDDVPGVEHNPPEHRLSGAFGPAVDTLPGMARVAA